MLHTASAPIKRKSENKFLGYDNFFKVADFFNDGFTQRNRRLLVGKTATKYDGYAFCDSEVL